MLHTIIIFHEFQRTIVNVVRQIRIMARPSREMRRGLGGIATDWAVARGILYQTVWILWADSACRQIRFAQSLKTINDNWKVGLIILIPLFYRGIRAFLERVEEFGGMKAPVKKATPDQPQGE